MFTTITLPPESKLRATVAVLALITCAWLLQLDAPEMWQTLLQGIGAGVAARITITQTVKAAVTAIVFLAEQKVNETR